MLKIDKKWRRRALSAVAVLALAPVIPGLMMAEAHSFQAASSVTIAFNSRTSNFHGLVSSPRAACEAGRTVWLVKKSGNQWTQLAADNASGTNGGWTVHRAAPTGMFRARVTRSESGGYGHSHVCLPDTSGTLKV